MGYDFVVDHCRYPVVTVELSSETNVAPPPSNYFTFSFYDIILRVLFFIVFHHDKSCATNYILKFTIRLSTFAYNCERNQMHFNGLTLVFFSSNLQACTFDKPDPARARDKSSWLSDNATHMTYSSVILSSDRRFSDTAMLSISVIPRENPLIPIRSNTPGASWTKPACGANFRNVAESSRRVERALTSQLWGKNGGRKKSGLAAALREQFRRKLLIHQLIWEELRKIERPTKTQFKSNFD